MFVYHFCGGQSAKKRGVDEREESEQLDWYPPVLISLKCCHSWYSLHKMPTRIGISYDNLLVHLLHPQPWSFPPCTRVVCSRFLSCKILNVYLAHCSTEREHFGVFYFSEKSLGGCWGKRSPSWTFRPNRGLWRGTYAMRCLMFNKSQILQCDILQRYCQIRW